MDNATMRPLPYANAVSDSFILICKLKAPPVVHHASCAPCCLAEAGLSQTLCSACSERMNILVPSATCQLVCLHCNLRQMGCWMIKAKTVSVGEAQAAYLPVLGKTHICITAKSLAQHTQYYDGFQVSKSYLHSSVLGQLACLTNRKLQMKCWRLLLMLVVRKYSSLNCPNLTWKDR